MPKRHSAVIKSSQGSVIVVLVLLMSTLLGIFAGTLAGYVRSAPTLAEVEFSPKMTTYVYDAQGKVITRFYKENRDLLPYERIPAYLKQAVVAIEDERFFSHHGVDFRSFIRALFVNIKAGAVVQGGSTITQQLAKNAFLTSERTISRKLRELMWTIQIERRYSKTEILEAYMNQVYFGHGAHGVEAAAQTYFGKSATQVTLAEAAFLAGVTRGPSIYSPFVDYNAAVARRNTVLSRMESLGYISAAAAQAARNTKLVTTSSQPGRQVAPYFVDYILQTLLRLYGENRVYGGGLRVYTSLDLDMQVIAEKTLINGLPTLKTDHNGLQQPQGALIAIEPETGYIKAMVGGRGTDKFNRAVQAYRQPGSAIKPILYAAAMENGYTPASILKDEPLTIVNGQEKWSPENYDRQYRGNISLRKALEESVNIIAIKLLQDLGPRAVLDFGRRLGLSSLVDTGEPNDLNASLALGGLTKGVSPLEITAAYAAFANAGQYITPTAITKITDSNGVVLFQQRPQHRTVLSEALAYLMTDMMQGVIERGTGKQAQIGRPAAGKTGTSSDYTNAWFVGYTPQLATAVWIGNDLQREPMSGPNGNIGSGKAAAIWGSFMKEALANSPIMNFHVPTQGLRENVPIDIRNGLIVPPNCSLPAGYLGHELFMENYLPLQVTPSCL